MLGDVGEIGGGGGGGGGRGGGGGQAQACLYNLERRQVSEQARWRGSRRGRSQVCACLYNWPAGLAGLDINYAPPPTHHISL